MTEILVFCESKQVAFELLSGAVKIKAGLNTVLAAAMIGPDAGDVNDYFAYGADKVYSVKGESFAGFRADTYASALETIAKQGANIILIGSTKRGKELAPRVAQRLAAGCITDAIGLELKDGGLLTQRYMLGGNTIATESIRTPVKVISIMPRTFKPGEKQPKQGQVIEIAYTPAAGGFKVLEKKEKTGAKVNLEEAKTLVCIGRGLQKKEDLPLVEQLAGAIKAELGCTRPLAYDLHWLPEEREVGLSGKKCKPDLCLVLGISGQIQHTVGIQDSKIIAAVNKDKNAPIFRIVDYGIVGDLYDVVPRLIAKAKGQ